MTSDELDRLEALAKAATPGPWEHETGYGAIGSVEAGGLVLAQTQQRTPRDNARRDRDAAYIAALHPGTALALIHEVKQVRYEMRILNQHAQHDAKEIARLRALVERAFMEGLCYNGSMRDSTTWKHSDAKAALEAR